MFFNLGGLRDFCLAQRSWQSTGTEFNDRLRRSFAFAYQRLVGDVPKAVQPEQVHAIILAHTKGEDTIGTTTPRRYLQRTTDPWVLEFVDSTGTPYTPTPPVGAWVPTVDGTWDGIMHLEIEDTKDALHRRQSREWWVVVDTDILGVPILTHYYVSLDRPFPAGSQSELLDFRIHQPKFYLSDRVIGILPPIRIWDDTHQRMWPIAFGNAMANGFEDYRGETTGRPEMFMRDEQFQIQAPNRSPIPSIGDKVSWLGPENRGTFRFRYTRVWGRRPKEWQDSPGGTRDPTWESAPSPISATFTHSGNDAIVVTVPEIDWMQNFGDPADLRYSRTGYRTRIYVARDEIQVGAPGAHPTVEKAGIFYLLGEIEGHLTTYTWDGKVVPDYFRRLGHSTGYFGYRTYPYPDDDYTLDMQVINLPDILIDDQDTPRLQMDAQAALVEIFLHYLAREDGCDVKTSEVYLGHYNTLLPDLRKKYGNDGGVVLPTPFTGRRRGYDRGLASTFTTT
jgi:hypothetical protein